MTHHPHKSTSHILPPELWSDGILPFIPLLDLLQSLIFVDSSMHSHVYQSIQNFQLYNENLVQVHNRSPTTSIMKMIKNYDNKDDKANEQKRLDRLFRTERLNRLKHVHVSFCDSFDNDSLRNIVKNNGHLQSLTLVHLNQVTELTPVFQLKKLVELRLNDLRNLERRSGDEDDHDEETILMLKRIEMHGCLTAEQKGQALEISSCMPASHVESAAIVQRTSTTGPTTTRMRMKMRREKWNQHRRRMDMKDQSVLIDTKDQVNGDGHSSSSEDLYEQIFLNRLLNKSRFTCNELSIDRMDIRELIVPCMNQLTHCSINRCFNLSRVLFKQKWSHVQHLNLSRSCINDESLYQLFESTNFVCLRELRLDYCHEVNHMRIENPRTRIEKLSLDRCSRLESVELENNIGHNIKSLVLSNTNISVHSLENLLKTLPNLESLECVGCNNLRRVVIPHIPSRNHVFSSSYVHGSPLKNLNLSLCLKLESIHFGKPNSDLEELILDWTLVSDHFIEHVLFYCFGLKILRARMCDNIVNPRIRHKNLSSLDLSGCLSLHSPSIQCDKLEGLNVSNCLNLAANYQSKE